MSRIPMTLVAAGLVAAASGVAAQDSSELGRSTYHDFRIVTVADGLVNPWSMAFLPGGDMLVTERPGRLRIVRDGELLSAPVEGVPAVLARGLSLGQSLLRSGEQTCAKRHGGAGRDGSCHDRGTVDCRPRLPGW